MRGCDAGAVIRRWEERLCGDSDRDRADLLREVAEAIETAYREGCDAGRSSERQRLREVLGL